MTLGDVQRQFAADFADLLREVFANGYAVQLGEVARSPVQAEINALDLTSRQQLIALVETGFPLLGQALRDMPGAKVGIRNSLHRDRCAADVILSRGGAISPAEAYEQFGAWWKQKSDAHRWGGDFGDSYHFSITPDGVRS